MDNVLKGYIEKLKSVDTVEEYETFISNLHQMLKQESYKNDIVQTIRNKQKYDGWKCFYYITFLQEFVLTIVGGYIGILFLLILSMLVSAKMRSSVFAVVVPFVMLLIPSFVADFSVLSKILGVLPDQLLQISSSINNFNLCQIGDKVIGAIPILFIVYLTCCFILLPLLYRVYKKSELKS